MANTKLSAKRGLKMDTHIRRLLIIMVCWFIFMGKLDRAALKERFLHAQS